MKFLPRLTLAHKLILTMMATSSTALLVACILFLSYDVITLRHNIADHLDTLADITGGNVAAALTYNDPCPASGPSARHRQPLGARPRNRVRRHHA